MEKKKPTNKKNNEIDLSKNLKGDFLPGFPHTHRGCSKVKYSGWDQPIKCGVKEFAIKDIDNVCQFERKKCR